MSLTFTPAGVIDVGPALTLYDFSLHYNKTPERCKLNGEEVDLELII